MHKLVSGCWVLGLWLSLISVTFAQSLPVTAKFFLSSVPQQARGLNANLDVIWAKAWPLVALMLGFLLLWLLGSVVLFLLGRHYSTKTLAMVEKLQHHTAATPQEAQMRARYAKLIDLAAIYYYLTLPAVACALLLVASGTIYACLWLGIIPLKLLIFLVIGTLVLLWKMLQSLFIQPDEEESGRPLTPAEAPGFFQLTREVAQAIGTRPVDEIRIVPGVACAVYEDGSHKEKAQDAARRVLIFGLALAPGMRQNALRSILAHEYGHFLHRDTAGGALALQMRQRLNRFLLALYFNGNSEYSIPVLMLRAYVFIFVRISQGAARLQEILADRVSASCYGAQTFREGMIHVVRRSLEFDEIAERQLRANSFYEAGKLNLYTPHLQNTGTTSAELKEAVLAQLHRPTTAEDSHPSPAERFRLIARVPCRAPLPPEGHVLDLFAAHEELSREMSQQIKAAYQAHMSVMEQAWTREKAESSLLA